MIQPIPEGDAKAGTIVEGEELTAMQAITLAIMDAKPVDDFPVPRGELAAWRYGKDCALAAAREALHDWSAPRTDPSSDRVVARLETACARAEDEYPKLAAPDGTVAVEIADLRALLTRYELIRSGSLIV